MTKAGENLFRGNQIPPVRRSRTAWFPTALLPPRRLSIKKPLDFNCRLWIGAGSSDTVENQFRENESVSEIDRGEQIRAIFAPAVESASIELPEGLRLDLSTNSEGATVSIRPSGRGEGLELQFRAMEDDGVFVRAGKRLIAVGLLTASEAQDIIAQTIRFAVADQFGHRQRA
jgi:hypothetical protein